MFQGRFEHTLDDKGRLAIPSPFRKRLAGDDESSGDGTVVVTISDMCLAAYAIGEWEQKLGQIAKLNQFDPKVMAFKRIFVGCAQECPIDKAGRILVPADLRRDAQIGRDAVILGQIEKFEIWGQDRWQKTFNNLTDQVGNIFASLAQSGIQI